MEGEPKLDPAQEQRESFDRIFKVLDRERPVTALETLNKLQGALAVFEEGVKLGRQDPEQTQGLIDEFKKRMEDREQEIGEALYPSRRL